MAKLWDKGYELDATVEKFTVGEDYILDMDLVKWDCTGSIAHARMLNSIGILADAEYAQLKGRLNQIVDLHAKGEFAILFEHEDVHTAVEGDLTETLGDVGKKLHTARSRNDQIVLDLRLYMRDKILEVADAACAMATVLVDFAEKHKDVPLVGRTHFQRAMPSSVGLWAGALAESMLDNIALLKAAYAVADQCPLGSAASYGVNLNIDRQMVSDSLGFAKVQNNVLYANNARGKVEAIILSALVQIMNDLSKLSADVILWSMPEFGYFSLPPEFCPGSSLMPQKRNPDHFELTRAKAVSVQANLFEALEIVRPLISGYHRDFQLTKKPLMASVESALATLRVNALTVAGLGVNTEACIAAFGVDCFATDRVMNLVKGGMAFRDAYREVAKSLDSTDMEDPVANIQQKTHLGATGNLGLDLARKRIEEETAWAAKARAIWEKAVEELTT
jgi:argininosuccinate lyase